MKLPIKLFYQDFVGGYGMFFYLIDSSDIDMITESASEEGSQEIRYKYYHNFEEYKNQILRYLEEAKKDILKTLNNKLTRFEKLQYISLTIGEVSQALNKLTQTDGKFSHKEFISFISSSKGREAKTLTEDDIQDYYQLIHNHGTEFLNYIKIIESSVKDTADGDFPPPDPLSGIPPRSSKNNPLIFFEYFFIDGGFTGFYQDHFAFPDGIIDPYANKPSCEKESNAEFMTSAVSQDDFYKQFENKLRAKVNDEFYLTRKYIDERVNCCTSESEVALFLKTQLYSVKSIHARLLKNKQAIEYDICEKSLKAIIRFVFQKYEPYVKDIKSDSYYGKILGLVLESNGQVNSDNQSELFKTLEDEFSKMENKQGKGWDAVFTNKGDYDKFIGLLHNYFDNEECKLPDEPIKVKGESIKQITRAVRRSYSKIKHTNKLKGANDYFDIVKSLDCFKDFTYEKLNDHLTKYGS